MDQTPLPWSRDIYLLANAAAFGFFFAIESGHGAMVPQLQRWRHIGRNLSLWIVMLVLTDVIVLAWWLDVPRLLTASNGLLTPLRLSPLAQFVVGFLLVDLFQYGFHVAAHRFRWLWFLHAVHHSDPELDASSALRFHPVEAALQYALLTALLLALGIPLWVEGARAAIANPVALFQHANHAFPAWLQRALGRFLVTPPMHRLHHSAERAECDSNYGVTLVLWDRLFGTYREPVAERPSRYGVQRCDDPAWQSLAGMLLTPLRLAAESLRRG